MITRIMMISKMYTNFEKNVKYHFDFTGDQLIIGKFCMIASDAKFIYERS
ncbi:MAG: hypothetical protein U0T85_01755 [Cloacibacterium normanense]